MVLGKPEEAEVSSSGGAAIATRATGQSDDAASRYPRKGPVLWLRRTLLVCWFIIATFLVNAGSGLYALANDNPAYLTDWNRVKIALLLPKPLNNPQTPALVFAASGALFILVLVGCLWATLDQRRDNEYRSRPILIIPPESADTGLGNYFGPVIDLPSLLAPKHLVGRDTELEWVERRLIGGKETSITALSGMGGVGKSAIAAKAAHQLQEAGHFKDGIVVVHCDEKTDATTLLRDALSRFAPYGRSLDTMHDRDLGQVANSLVGGKDALIVLDNVEPDIKNLDRVINTLHKAGAKLLLTSRQSLIGELVTAEDNLHINLLPADAALQVFLDAYGQKNYTNPAEQLDPARRIVEILANHTLALKLAGSYAAETGRDLHSLVRDLEQDPFEVPRNNETRAVEKILNQSIEKLPEAAKVLFAALAAFATPEFGRTAVIEMARALDIAQAKSMIDLLVQRAVIESSVDVDMDRHADRERFQIHPLVRKIANDRFQVLPESQRTGALSGIAYFYARYIGGVSSRSLYRDRGNILGAIVWAHHEGEQRLVSQLCIGMAQFWREHGMFPDALQALPLGIESTNALAQQTGKQEDRRNAALLSLAFGQVLMRVGKLSDAASTLELIRPVFNEVGDHSAAGRTLSTLGEITRRKGSPEEARKYFESALTELRIDPDLAGEADALTGLSDVLLTLGHLEDAEKLQIDGLAIYRNLKDLEGEGIALGELGQIERDIGHPDAAEDYFKRALKIHRDMQARPEEAAALLALAQVAQIRGELDEADVALKEALEIHQEVQERQGEGVDLFELGKVAKERGQLDEAEAYVRKALDIQREVQDLREESICLRALGQIAQARGQPGIAENHYRHSLDISRNVQWRRGQGVVLTLLGQVVLERGDEEQAEADLREGLAILREVKDGIGSATAALALGTFLITRHGDRTEGCKLICEAVDLRHAQKVPTEDEARAAAQSNGCACGSEAAT